MAARVQHKRTLTAGAAPAASEFLEGELILQLADKKLFAKDSSNVVFEVGAPKIVAQRITGVTEEFNVSNPPSGVATFDIGTGGNGQIVLISSSSADPIAGLWRVNTAGLWSRLEGWETGSVHPQGTLLILSDSEFFRIWILNDGTINTYFVIGNLYTDLYDFLEIRRGETPLRTESNIATANNSTFFQVGKTLRWKPDFSPDNQMILGVLPNLFEAQTDCVANVNNENFTFTVSGTGAAFSSLAIGAEDAVGILRWSSGTVATNRSSIASPNFSVIRLSKGLAKFVARHRLPVLSDATNTYTTRIGFIDSVTAESTDGVFFRYTNGVNAGEWQAVCRNNGVETGSAVDTNVAPVANTWQRFSIEVNPDGTSAKFYINDALVATITTNIPIASGRELGYGVFTLRSVGTVSINMGDTDYIQVQQVFTNRR